MGRGSGERVKVKGGVMRAKGSGDSGKSGRLKGYFGEYLGCLCGMVARVARSTQALSGQAMACLCGMVRGVVVRFLLVGVVIFSIFSAGCHIQKPPPPDENHYDPRNISRTETDSYGPSIAIGPDGTVYVAWMDGGHGEYENSHIYFRYKHSGEDWSDIEILSDTTTDSWSPQLAVDPSGNLHLVWEEQDPDLPHAKIYYRMREPSGEWTGIQVLATGGAEQPRIAVDPSGTVHVVWLEGSSLKYKAKSSGGSWGPRETLPVGSQGAVNPAICSDAEGGVHVVYEAGNEDIKYLYRSPTGQWSEPVNVSQSPSWYSWVPSVAVNSSGLV